MKKIPAHSSWNLPATGKQTTKIAQLCMALGYKTPYENKVSNRLEARNMIAGLTQELKNRR